MPLIALKIDVDTLRGTRVGVPALTAMLEAHDAPATFLFSLGPDHTGRAIKRVFRPGFFSKVQRTSVVSHYGIKTLMYGTLLPGPDIGRHAADFLRRVRDTGFECGVHTWDHVLWQDQVNTRDALWTRMQMRLAFDRFTEILKSRPAVHGAAGWQINEHALLIEDELGYRVASDTRGDGPFRPWMKSIDKVLQCVQLPTTLPTIDELIGMNGLEEGGVANHLLQMTRCHLRNHVFTLHAELEGQKLASVFKALLKGWREQGYRFATLSSLAATLEFRELPACAIQAGSVSGRSGTVAKQGASKSAIDRE